MTFDARVRLAARRYADVVNSRRSLGLLLAAGATTIALIGIQVGSLADTLARLDRDEAARVRTALARVRERIDPGDALEREIRTLLTPGGFDAELDQGVRLALRRMLDRELAEQGMGSSTEVRLWRGDAPDPAVPADADRATHAVKLSRGLSDDGIHLGVVLPGRRGLARLTDLPVLGPVSVALALAILGLVFAAVRIASRLEALSNRQRAFVENFTHEIRTPVFALSLAAKALEEDARLPPDALPLVARVRSAAGRVGAHVERLGQLVTLEHEGPARSVRVDVHEILNSVADECRARIDAVGGRFDVSTRAQCALVRGDAEAWRSVLDNLLDNALRYSVDAPDVTLTTHDEGARFVLVVEDRGRGVPDSERERVFERYYRVEQGTVRDTKGLGLGLAIAREVARSAGGTIRCEARDGDGTRFIVRVPRAPDAEEDVDG